MRDCGPVCLSCEADAMYVSEAVQAYSQGGKAFMEAIAQFAAAVDTVGIAIAEFQAAYEAGRLPGGSKDEGKY